MKLGRPDLFEARISELIGFNTCMEHKSSVFEDPPGDHMFGVIMVKKFLERIENIYNSCALAQNGDVPEYTAIYNFLSLSQNTMTASENGFPLLPVLLDIIS